MFEKTYLACDPACLGVFDFGLELITRSLDFRSQG